MRETENHLFGGWCSKCLQHKNHLSIKIELFKLLFKKGKVILMAHKNHDMAHTKQMCKYYIVFTSEYNRTKIANDVMGMLYGMLQSEIEQLSPNNIVEVIYLDLEETLQIEQCNVED